MVSEERIRLTPLFKDADPLAGACLFDRYVRFKIGSTSALDGVYAPCTRETHLFFQQACRVDGTLLVSALPKLRGLVLVPGLLSAPDSGRATHPRHSLPVARVPETVPGRPHASLRAARGAVEDAPSFSLWPPRFCQHSSRPTLQVVPRIFVTGSSCCVSQRSCPETATALGAFACSSFSLNHSAGTKCQTAGAQGSFLFLRASSTL